MTCVPRTSSRGNLFRLGVFGANQLWWGLWNRTEVLCDVLGREDADQRVDGTLLPRGRGGLEMEMLGLGAESWPCRRKRRLPHLRGQPALNALQGLFPACGRWRREPGPGGLCSAFPPEVSSPTGKRILLHRTTIVAKSIAFWQKENKKQYATRDESLKVRSWEHFSWV